MLLRLGGHCPPERNIGVTVAPPVPPVPPPLSHHYLHFCTRNEFNTYTRTIIYMYMLLVLLSYNTHTADGFSAIRLGKEYPDEQLCDTSAITTILRFECDDEAKYNTHQPNITRYLADASRQPTAPCFVS